MKYLLLLILSICLIGLISAETTFDDTSDNNYFIEGSPSELQILISPASGSTFNVSLQNFTANLSDGLGIKNYTFNIYNNTNDLVNKTTIITPTNPFYATVGMFYNMIDGVFHWFYSFFDTAGNTYSTENYTLTIDLTIPSVNITYPQNISYTGTITSLNYTAVDSNLQTCWYSLDGGTTKNYITCGQNVIGLASKEGSNTWTIYANDTAGNMESSSITFSSNRIVEPICSGFTKSMSYLIPGIMALMILIGGGFTLVFGYKKEDLKFIVLGFVIIMLGVVLVGPVSQIIISTC